MPTIIFLLFEVFLLLGAISKFSRNKILKPLIALLITMIVCTIIELTRYGYVAKPESFEMFLRIYYASFVIMFAYLLQLSLSVINEDLSPTIERMNLGIAVIICLLLLFTEEIIAGASSIKGSVVMIPGDFLSILQIYVGAILIFSLSILIYGYQRVNEVHVRVRVLYIFIAIISLIFPAIIAIGVIAVVMKLNMVIILSICLVLFLSFITYAIRNDTLFDLRFWLPFSDRYKLFKSISIDLLVVKNNNEISIKKLLHNYEKAILSKALLDYGDSLSQREIARRMGISESSFSRKRKEYGI